MKLPEGWTVERQYLQPGCHTLTDPEGRKVSVSFRYRLYSLGDSNPRWAPDRKRVPNDWGWQERLVREAVAYLEKSCQ
jgi:hypothetical protein